MGSARRVLEATTGRSRTASSWTYGDVAAAPRASRRAGRAAGSASRHSPIELFVPCHRVVHARGPVGRLRPPRGPRAMALAPRGCDLTGRSREVREDGSDAPPHARSSPSWVSRCSRAPAAVRRPSSPRLGHRPVRLQLVDGGGEQRPRTSATPALRGRVFCERRSGRRSCCRVGQTIAGLLLRSATARERRTGTPGGGHVRRRTRHAAGRPRAGAHRPERRTRHLSGGRHVRPGRDLAGDATVDIPGERTQTLTASFDVHRSTRCRRPGPAQADGEPDDGLDRRPSTGRSTRARSTARPCPTPIFIRRRSPTRSLCGDRSSCCSPPRRIA